MGKQIEFFMMKTDEKEFLEMIFDKGNMILDDKASPLLGVEIINLKSLSFYLAEANPNIFKSGNGFIDAITSEVIQFSRCVSKDEKTLQSGRLWMEFRYYDINRQIAVKSKQFGDMYNDYVKWIKKNYRLSQCKYYYIGNEAYEYYKKGNRIMMAGPQHIVNFN